MMSLNDTTQIISGWWVTLYIRYISYDSSDDAYFCSVHPIIIFLLPAVLNI